MLSLILLVFAFVLFVLAGFIGEPWRGRLVCFGLASLVASELMGQRVR